MFVLIEQIKRGFNPSYFGGEWRQGTVTREKNCIYETAESGRNGGVGRGGIAQHRITKAVSVAKAKEEGVGKEGTPHTIFISAPFV